MDMLGAAQKVRRFVERRTFDDYLKDDMLRSAVERQVEIIGEAARGLTGGFRDAHPEIPWRAIMAQRNRLAHEYDEIQDDLIWTVATRHVPSLIEQLEPLIPPLPPDTKQ